MSGTVPIGGVFHVVDLCRTFALADLTAKSGIVPDRRAASTDRFLERDLFILTELVEFECTPGGRYFPGQIAGPECIPSGRKIRLRRSPLLRAAITDRIRLLSRLRSFCHTCATTSAPTGSIGSG